MERVDIAIIGSGPAGISAAITARIRKKSLILYGEKALSLKISKAHRIMNYTGLPDITGEDLAAKLRDHLDHLDIEITEKRVTMIYAMGDYFVLQTSDGQMQEAYSVILACGMVQERPLPGEDAFLGRGVSYCVTCDAMFYKNKTALVVAYNSKAEEEADYLSEIAAKVYYIPMYKEEPELNDSVEIVRQKPTEIFGGMKVNGIRTEESEIPVDGVFLIRDAISPSKLVPGLVMDGNHVAVNLKMETNLPGFFACGDITGTPYQYIKAAGQGNVAALSAVSFLNAKRRER